MTSLPFPGRDSTRHSLHILVSIATLATAFSLVWVCEWIRAVLWRVCPSKTNMEKRIKTYHVYIPIPVRSVTIVHYKYVLVKKLTEI